MDDLFKLIDERVQKGVRNAPYVKSVPAKVLSLLENGLLEVSLLSNGVTYTVPNYSGSPAGIDDVVQLFYKGNVLSNQTAYIGAVAFRTSTNYVMADVRTGTMTSSEKKIAKMSVVAYQPNILLILNAMCENNNESAVTGRITIYIDGTLQTYRPQFTIVSGGTYHLSFTLPYHLTLGEHEIKITAMGAGVTIANVIAYAYGYVNEKISDFDPTHEEDYVWGTNSDGAEVYMYKGNSLNPEVIDELDGNTVDTLTLTSFNYSKVRSVYIPDGVTRIE